MEPAAAGLMALSALLLVIRWYAAKTVGFGDSEALYAAYALHPQPAYLDHPGLIGVFARAVGGGTAPMPAGAHAVTAVMATMVPWIASIVARSMGATRRAAMIAAIALAVTPEIAVGLFAMTPDLLLCFLWFGALGTAAVALEAEPKSSRAAVAFLGAGLLCGAAASAKVTGLLLLAGLVVTVLVAGRRHARTIWPWLGVAAGALVFWPVVQFEAARGWPMLHHRLVDTQHGAGLSLRNLGAVLGGQLVYVSPLLLVLVVWLARDLYRARKRDATSALLFWSFAVPIAGLLPLCLWSRVAEPHWLAPPLLALPLHAARTGVPVVQGGEVRPRWRKLTVGAGALGLALTLGVYAWVLSPSLLTLAPRSYDAKVDIANELYGWKDAARAAQEMDEEVTLEDPQETVWVVGPNWMICAQLAVVLPRARVGCASETPTDFDDWAPRAVWEKADKIVFVTDNRFPVEAAARVPHFHPGRLQRLSIFRGGRIVRTFELTLLERRARASR